MAVLDFQIAQGAEKTAARVARHHGFFLGMEKAPGILVGQNRFPGRPLLQFPVISGKNKGLDLGPAGRTTVQPGCVEYFLFQWRIAFDTADLHLASLVTD